MRRFISSQLVQGTAGKFWLDAKSHRSLSRNGAPLTRDMAGPSAATLLCLITCIFFVGRNWMRGRCLISWRFGKVILAGEFTRSVGPRSAPAATTLWQREFFDHVLRSAESYSEKWNYIRDNPVRAGLVRSADDWSYAGEVEALTL